MSMLRGYPSLDRGIAFGLMPGPSADVRVHPHRLHAEDGAPLEPPLGDLDAFLPQRLVRAREIRRRVVRDVLALDARRRHLRGQLVEPLPPRRAHRIEAAGEHAVVGDVAEQPREEIHVRHAGEVVLRELREVEHGDLAILLLHLRVRHAGVRVRLLPAAPAPARAGLSARRGGRRARGRRRRAGGIRRRARHLSAARAPAAAGARLEDRPDRPRARRNAGQLVLLGPRAALRRGGAGRLVPRQHQPRRAQSGPGGLEEAASIQAAVLFVICHEVFPSFSLRCHAARPTDSITRRLARTRPQAVHRRVTRSRQPVR